jgi:hypothetical protein
MSPLPTAQNLRLLVTTILEIFVIHPLLFNSDVDDRARRVASDPEVFLLLSPTILDPMGSTVWTIGQGYLAFSNIV